MSSEASIVYTKEAAPGTYNAYADLLNLPIEHC